MTVVVWKPKSASSSVTFFVDGGLVDGDGDDGNTGGLGAFEGEHAAVEVFEIGGGELVVVGGDELEARLVEVEGVVAVVGDDDPDRDHGVSDVREAKEVAVLLGVAGIDGDGDVLVSVSVVGGVFGGGFGGWGFLLLGVGDGRGEACEGEKAKEEGLAAVRIHAGSVSSWI